MDDLPHLHGPVEELLEIEIIDLPAGAEGQDRSMIWLEQAVLAWQWRRQPFASLLALYLLCLFGLGVVVENVAQLPTPRSIPASSSVIFPTGVTYAGHRGFVVNVAWSPDGTHFASDGGSDDLVRVRNRITDRDLVYRGHLRGVR
jgi:hypothetical protein